jgi:hypothetical protein
MLQSITSKASFIQLARSMKKAYIESPHNYFVCTPFQRMRHVIQGITIEHFSLPAFPPRISEGPIYIEDKLRVSLFFVPRGAEMPLHDHPGMFVLCKILKGRLIRDSFKLNSSYWQFAFPQQFMKVPTVLIQGKFQNKVLPSVWATKTTGLVKENDVDTVTPDTNLHRFVALEDSIFFDAAADEAAKNQTCRESKCRPHSVRQNSIIFFYYVLIGSDLTKLQN